MISPIDSAMHQGVGFLIRNDMVQHDVMQALLRSIAGELARPQAADALRVNHNSAAIAVETGMTETFGTLSASMVALLQDPRAVHPATAAHAAHLRNSADIAGRENEEKKHNNAQDSALEADLDEVEIAILQGITDRLPELLAAGFCSSMLVGLFIGKQKLPAPDDLWHHDYVTILIPQLGLLGLEHKIFAYGLSPRIPVTGMMGVHSQDDDPLLSKPVLSVHERQENQNFWPASVSVNRLSWDGRVCLVGHDEITPEVSYVLHLDHQAAEPG